MNPTRAVKEIKKQSTTQTRRAVNTPVVEGLARGGYIARGVVYALIGLLAARLISSGGGQEADQAGALQTLGAQPFGEILLVLITVGLLGYAMWGVIRALLDPLGRGSDAKGYLERGGFMLSGISYATLALLAFYYATGYGKASGGNSQDFTVQLSAQPFGKWLIVLLGLFWIVAGVGQLYTAWKTDFKKDLRHDLAANEKVWADRLGRAGYAARGVVFMLIGSLTLQGGLGLRSEKAVGFDDALTELSRQPFGPYLLGIVALGLIAFGVYSIMCARWMKVEQADQS